MNTKYSLSLCQTPHENVCMVSADTFVVADQYSIKQCSILAAYYMSSV